MARQPVRPFESLEWYREAARNNFRDDAPSSGFSAWASGLGMLHAHVSVYAVGIVVLLGVNLLRSPEDIWAGRWIMAWTVLVLLHAVVIGFLWAMRQWNSDAPDEAFVMAPPPARQGEGQPPAFGWGLIDDEAQDVDFRVANGARPASETTEPNPAQPAGWTGWNSDDADEVRPASERASWSQASAAAWLDRSRPAPRPDREPDATRDA